MTKKKRKRITSGPSSGLLGGRGTAYPFEMRLWVVKMVAEAGASIIAAAAAFRISPTTIANWLRLYEEGGAAEAHPDKFIGYELASSAVRESRTGSPATLHRRRRSVRGPAATRPATTSA